MTGLPLDWEEDEEEEEGRTCGPCMRGAPCSTRASRAAGGPAASRHGHSSSGLALMPCRAFYFISKTGEGGAPSGPPLGRAGAPLAALSPGLEAADA